MNFVKANLTSLLALFLYFVWWIYVVFDFGKTNFEKELGGADGKEIIVFITIGLVIAYSSAFLLAASITKKRKKYFAFIFVTIIPLIITYVINEVINK